MPELPPPLLSVIIPTINEATPLPLLLGDLFRQQGITLDIIIGDGGSSDGTAAVADRFGARCVISPPGRGVQMNRGAAVAWGEYFLFLHADSRLPSPLLLARAVEALRASDQKRSGVAGHFRLSFARCDGNNSGAYRYLEEKSSLNRLNTTNGDQGLLLARSFFFALGGFDESLPFLEDQQIAEKIRSCGRLITLPGNLETSPRRFETEGFYRRYLLMGMMMGLYSVGVSDFFNRAPGIYRLQQDTGKLRLTPFFDLLWQMIRHNWGITGTVKIFYLLGRYIRQNCWQLFFMVDVRLRPRIGEGRTPCLRFYDCIIRPFLERGVCDAIIGLCCFFWYMGVLALLFRLIESRSHRRHRS